MYKYTQTEFVKMMDEMLEEFKDSAEMPDADLETAYKILRPFPNSYFADGTIKMADDCDMYLWDMKINQIRNFVSKCDGYQMDDIIAYCRSKYFKEEVNHVIRAHSLADECDVCIYVDGAILNSSFPYLCAKVYVSITWIGENKSYDFRIYPSAAGFMSYQLKGSIEDDLKFKENMTILEMRELLKVSRAEFSRRYGIPARTLEDWENDKRTPPAYVLSLLERAVLEDALSGRQ